MGIKQKPSRAEKILHHEDFRQSISNYLGAFPASYTCCRSQPPAQTLNTPCHHHPNPQHSPGAPRLLSSPGTPSTGEVQIPPGKPQGIWLGKSLLGSSSPTMSRLGQGHSSNFRNYTGIILAPCLHSVQRTFTALCKQKIFCRMLSYSSKLKTPWP